jgi:DNA-binding response OmpR family regulator
VVGAPGEHGGPARHRAHDPEEPRCRATRKNRLRAIWGANAVDQPEHLWVLVAQLRKKIEPDPAHPRYVVSEPWVGYRLATEAPSP